MKKLITLSIMGIATWCSSAFADQTLLLQQPDLSGEKLTFVYAGDIWISNVDGTEPRRITSHPAEEKDPIFSPDGKWIAFSATYEGNRDVYMIPTTGGQPKRLTWHPGADIPVDWSVDGKEIAFVSSRETDHGRSRQLYHVSIEGGAPIKQMEARIVRGRYSKEGDLAYIIFRPGYNGLFGYTSGWKGYRGGTVPAINVMNADKSEVYTIDGAQSTNINPFWVNGKIYFLSDRNHKIFNLFEYDPANKTLSQVTEEDLWDVKAASGDGSTIVYETGGRIKTLNLKKNKTNEVIVSISPDLPQLRPQWKTAGDTIESYELSRTGKRALITARGEVFTIPVEEGSVRNLSQTEGKREYSAIWSPDSQSIAWITEGANGTQEVVIVDQKGNETDKRYTLGNYFYELRLWTDGANPRIVFTDNHLNLYDIDLESGEITKIDTGYYRSHFYVDASTDGRWLTYTLESPNHYSELLLYNFESKEKAILSDGMADVISPTFSPDGKYLFFGASTNSGPLQIGLNMTSQEKPFRAALYAAILSANEKSPLLPKAGDEEMEEEDEAETEDEATEKDETEGAEPSIDLDGIQHRIVALPIAQRNHDNLEVSKSGDLYYIDYVQRGIAVNPPGESLSDENRLMVFKMEDKEEKELMSGVNGFELSADGEHILINKVDGSLVTSKLGDSLDTNSINTSGAKLLIDPRIEWTQIFDECWRMQKEYFYASNMHGLDWDAIYTQYRPLVEHVGRREDLNTLMVEMIAELHAGHNRVGGGDLHHESGQVAGLLGVNLNVDNGLYQISKVYNGEAWNPYVDAPLAVPGNEANEGEYILSINGRKLTAHDNIFERLQGTTGKQVTLELSSKADGSDSREIVVEPCADESDLRLWSWVEDNRRKVDEATNGEVGYIYLPNTAGAGYSFFNRMFFAQVDKKALIIDERSNGGGQAANYFIEVLGRKHLSGWADRDGHIYNTPFGAVHGPKLMLIDQDAGSGGDYLPFTFRDAGLGKLLGTRTWGGLIGIATNPMFVDGGRATVPFFRFFDPEGNWSVENEGVAPDIEVELDPIAANKGIDSQLAAGIEEILSQLEQYEDKVLRKAPPLPTKLGE